MLFEAIEQNDSPNYIVSGFPHHMSEIKEFKKMYPKKDIWCYSGYTYEQITGKTEARCSTPEALEMLSYIDVLVDGKFDKDLYSIRLKFRGSSNQRLIDLNKTRSNGEIILWEEE